jgi:hypothetical protein
MMNANNCCFSRNVCEMALAHAIEATAVARMIEAKRAA